MGGIPLQIENGKGGVLLDPADENGFAEWIIRILRDDRLAEKLGKNGHDHVKKNFLIVRLLSDYLDLLTDILSP